MVSSKNRGVPLMKKRWFILPIVIAVVVAIKVIDIQQGNAELPTPTSNALQLRINPEPIVSHPNRVAINLGDHTNGGASQLLQNVLVNPGFEGTIDRIVVIPKETEEWAFSDEENYPHPDGAWDGAVFNIRSGPLAGTTGKVINSYERGPNGLPYYEVDRSLIGLNPKEGIVLTQILDRDPTNGWWLGKGSDRLSAAPGDTPPTSQGNQSLRFELNQGSPVEVISYLDHLAEKAGKQLPVNGKWRFKAWMRAAGENTKVQVSFRRGQSFPFFVETLTPNSQWQEYAFDFDAKDSGPTGILEFKIAAVGDNAELFVDDLWLGPVEDNPTVFRQQVVDALQELRPSFLRSFPPFGDTFENLTAAPTARRLATSRIWNQPASAYNYSVGEFLDLCAHVGANPWLIVPATFTDTELTAFGQFLAQNAPQGRFSEVIVEFGNENWNWMFRATGYPYPELHGAIAKRAFDLIQQKTQDHVNLRKVINGEHALPWMAGQFLEKTPDADTLAVAPYFINSLDADTSPSAATELLFQNDGGLLAKEAAKAKGLGKSMAIYEMNLHTASGTATEAERTPIVAGAASGAALAKRILDSMSLGVDPIAIYRLAQFETPTWDVEETVPLWGIVRNFGPPIRYRPTGLAISLLNQAIGGNMYSIESTPEAENLTIAAFNPSDGWTAAIVSSHPEPIELEITFPEDSTPIPTFARILNAPSALSTNEDNENVRITKEPIASMDRTVRITVPSCGCAVLGTTEEKHPVASITSEPNPLPPHPTKTEPTMPPEEVRQRLLELREERQELNREFRQQQDKYQEKLNSIREEQQALRDQLEASSAF